MTENNSRLLVALDLRPPSDVVLAEAERFARLLAVEMDIVHVAEDEPDAFISYHAGPESVVASVAGQIRSSHRSVQEYRARVEAAGLKVGHALTLQGSPAEVILAQVRKTKPVLLVLGASHAKGLAKLFHGNVVDDVVEHAPCPILVVPLSA